MITDGRQVIAHRKPTSIDWSEARREGQAAAERVWCRAGVLFGGVR